MRRCACTPRLLWADWGTLLRQVSRWTIALAWYSSGGRSARRHSDILWFRLAVLRLILGHGSPYDATQPPLRREVIISSG